MTNEKIHTIDGVKYREVERKARVGEKVVVTAGVGVFVEGDILFCIHEDRWSGSTGISAKGYLVPNAERDCGEGLYHREYRVLEPIEEPTPDLLDIIANLTTKVLQLEKENRALRVDIQKLNVRTYPLVLLGDYYEIGVRQ
ncbi:hypothetical protein [Bacillus sp. JJ722]|uniref:hypothetical protein n=1 Tax=Bacillus sp. JJ722 TaxID=3122973 RepID=UPI002FFE37D2